MTTDPFDEELETDTVVPSDVVPVPVEIIPVASVEDFNQRLAKLSPDDLAFALAQMLADKRKTDPGSQKPD